MNTNSSNKRAPPPRTQSSGFGIAPRRYRLPGAEDTKRQRQRQLGSSSHGNSIFGNNVQADLASLSSSTSAAQTNLRLSGDVRPRLGRRAPASPPSSSTPPPPPPPPPAPEINVPQSLLDAIRGVQRLVPSTRTGRAALERLDQQIANLHVALQLDPKLTLYAPSEEPALHKLNPKNPNAALMESEEEEDTNNNHMADPYDQASAILPVGVGMTCATYPANDPSEDRYTVVLGSDFVFCGVWDGHGGHQAAEYTAKHIFQHVQSAVLQGQAMDQALNTAFQKTDEGYLEYARMQKDPKALFAGTCALACYMDLATGKMTCANAGDSRAVAALVQDDQVQVIPLSTDHTTDNLNEQARCKRQHPHDTRLFVNTEPDPSEAPDWRLKGIAAFTRSLGDTHLKDKTSAALFNSYMPPHRRIVPRPGIKPSGAEHKTSPYLSCEPEITSATVKEGFVILACDGIWDEMSSEEAVQIVYDLIVADDGANIADLFIEATLEKAVTRIAQSDPDEAQLTLEQLKARPTGKADWSHRSNLHDDLTVVIVQFNGVEPPKLHSSFSSLADENLEMDQAAVDSGTMPPPSARPRPPPPSRSVWKTESNLSTFSRESLFSMESGTDDNNLNMDGTGGEAHHHPSMVDLNDSMLMNMSMMDTFEEGQVRDLDRDDLAELISTRLGRRVPMDKIEEIFTKLDLNHTGRIRRTDFETWWGRKSQQQSVATKRQRKRDAAYSAMTSETIQEQADDNMRQSTNDQIIQMIELFGGMSSAHLRVLFDVLDAEGSGILEEDEVKFLLRKVLGADPTDILVETTFAEMDEDKSGGIEFTEFCNFFGID